MSGEMRFKQRFIDHHKYTSLELDKMFQQAKNSGADVMITTEKDAVRIPPTTNQLFHFILLGWK